GLRPPQRTAVPPALLGGTPLPHRRGRIPARRPSPRGPPLAAAGRTLRRGRARRRSRGAAGRPALPLSPAAQGRPGLRRPADVVAGPHPVRLRRAGLRRPAGPRCPGAGRHVAPPAGCPPARRSVAVVGTVPLLLVPGAGPSCLGADSDRPGPHRPVALCPVV